MIRTLTNDPGDSNPVKSSAIYDYDDESLEPNPSKIDGAAPVCKFQPVAMLCNRLHADLKESA